MPEIFKWKSIGRYVGGLLLLDITAFFWASLSPEVSTIKLNKFYHFSLFSPPITWMV